MVCTALWHAWQDKLLPPTPSNKNEVARFVAGGEGL